MPNDLIPAHGIFHFLFSRLKALFSLKAGSCLVAYYFGVVLLLLLFFPDEIYTPYKNRLSKINEYN